MDKPPVSINFIGGLGGRDITKNDLEEAYDKLLSDDTIDKIQYMNVRCDNNEA